jgi:hypothetical protein
MTHENPIIVIGMHRSGTSMIVQMLKDMGVFMGASLEENNEATLFLELNDWLLAQCQAGWYSPSNIRHIIDQPVILDAFARYLSTYIATRRIKSYIGRDNYIRGIHLPAMNVPWGWKDPRNTFTLQVWLKLFPGARIINIYRNGVDVAQSLVCRSIGIENSVAGDVATRIRKIQKNPFYNHSWRCLLFHPKFTLDSAFDLWEQYVAEASRYAELLADRSLTIKYEDFLANPLAEMKRLARFCNLPGEEDVLASLAGGVRKGRAFAYKGDAELERFYNEKKQTTWMKKLGYSS